MRKVSKALALLLSVCLLLTAAISASAAVSPEPNTSYRRPDQTINQITSDITIDGVLEDAWKKEATEITFTKAALKQTGLVWSYTADDGETWVDMPSDGEGTAYVGWTADYFLFALEVKDATNTNNQLLNSELWKGDCLQLQIGADASAFGSSESVSSTKIERYEFGFATSSARAGRNLGYQWRPSERELSAPKAQKVSAITGDYSYYVVHKNGTTTYEVALKYSLFGRTSQMKKGDIIPFSFSLHLYKDNPVDENDNGWFMEWARGTVGGDTEGSDILDPWFGVKNIGSAARLTLGDPAGPVGGSTTRSSTTTTTTKTSTTRSTTTRSSSGNAGGTSASGNAGNAGGTSASGKTSATSGSAAVAGGTTASGNAGGATVSNNSDVTTTETTTTTAPEIEGVSAYYADDNAEDVADEEIVGAITAQMETDEVAIPEGNEMLVKAYKPGAAKFAIATDGLSAIYSVDADGNYTKLEGEVYTDEDGVEDEGWLVYDVSALDEDAVLYVVKNFEPTTVPVTTATTAADITTTKNGATTTTANDGGDETGGSSWWIWLIIILVVLVVVALLLFFFLKKKKEDEENTDVQE